MTGFSHCTKMVPVKSHNDFSRPLVHHFYRDASSYDMFRDRRVVEICLGPSERVALCMFGIATF